MTGMRTNEFRGPLARRLFGWTAALVTLGTLATASPAAAGNIIEELRREGRFTTLLAALEATNLTHTVARCQSCTLFAPNDRAFARLPAGTVAAFLQPRNKGKLAAILTYHVVGARVPASAVPAEATLVQTLNASEAKIQAVRNAGKVRINGVRVLEADIQANGSIIHEVRDVLWPGEIR